MNIFKAPSSDTNLSVADQARSTSAAASNATRSKEQLLKSAGLTEQFEAELGQRLEEFKAATQAGLTDIRAVRIQLASNLSLEIPINTSISSRSPEEIEKFILARVLGQVSSNPLLKGSKDLISKIKFEFVKFEERETTDPKLIESGVKYQSTWALKIWPASDAKRTPDGKLVEGTFAELFGIRVESAYESKVGMTKENGLLRDQENSIHKNDRSKSSFPGLRIVSRNSASILPKELAIGAAIFAISATTANGDTIRETNLTEESLQKFYDSLLEKGHEGAKLTIHYYGNGESLRTPGAKDKTVTFTIPKKEAK